MLGLIVSLALIQSQAPAGGSAPAAAPATAPAAAPAATAPAPTATAPAATPSASTATEPTKAAPAKADAAPPPANLLAQFLPFLPVFILLYFMMIRPQRQEEKKRKELLSRMQRNDKIITAGGMYGTIVAVDAESDTVTVRLGSDPGVKVDFTKASVVRVISSSEKKDATS